MKGGGNIYLVGMMGAGKTTAGKLLARRLKLDFLDSDQEIERRCGVTVPVIFEIDGEGGFRRRGSRRLSGGRPGGSPGRSCSPDPPRRRPPRLERAVRPVPQGGKPRGGAQRGG